MPRTVMPERRASVASGVVPRSHAMRDRRMFRRAVSLRRLTPLFLQREHRKRGVPAAVFPQRCMGCMHEGQRFFVLIMDHMFIIVPEKEKRPRMFLGLLRLGPTREFY